MQIKIEGRIISGGGTSSATLSKQWPKLIKHVPQFSYCFQGTINVELSSPVLIVNPERTVPPFEWEPGQIEGFGILEILFEWPLDTKPFQAWVYLAQHSFHRYNMARAEVITREIIRLRDKTDLTDDELRCRLHYLSVSGFII
jgi:hypothetical protein